MTDPALLFLDWATQAVRYYVSPGQRSHFLGTVKTLLSRSTRNQPKSSSCYVCIVHARILLLVCVNNQMPFTPSSAGSTHSHTIPTFPFHSRFAIAREHWSQCCSSLKVRYFPARCCTGLMAIPFPLKARLPKSLRLHLDDCLLPYTITHRPGIFPATLSVRPTILPSSTRLPAISSSVWRPV